jgi:hypothetical protein
MYVVGCDPGISNLGFVYGTIDENGNLNVIHSERVNLAKETESKHIVFRTEAFMERFKDFFEKSEIIIMERQPPGSGGEVVAALIFSKFREKIVEVSPRTQHKKFGLSRDYDTRKRQAVGLAGEHIDDAPGERMHDIADAVLLCMAAAMDIKHAERKRRAREIALSAGFQRFAMK